MNIFNVPASTVREWVLTHWFPLLIVIAAAWLALRFGTMLIDKVVRRAVRQSPFSQEYLAPEDIKKRQDTLVSMLTALWKTAVWVVGVLTFVSEASLFNTAPLLASAGIVGVALGFGAQSVIKDLLSGVFIIIENQYRVGDTIDIDGIGAGAPSGTVERITIRSTVLRDIDGNVHFIPNGAIVHVTNKTMGFSKVNFTLGVDPSTNVDELADIINKVGEKLSKDPAWADKIIEAPRFLRIGTFTDTTLEVRVTGKTQPSAQWSVTGELRKRLLSALKRNKIDLAKL
jgi:moderate conductance mechanosensitive channel